jgi:hypothetical protein
METYQKAGGKGPDDVHGMARAVGILTSTGGLASHAAVVARGWGIPAVVGAGGVVVRDGTVSIEEPRWRRAGHHHRWRTGRSSSARRRRSTRSCRRQDTLLGWARELDVPIGEAEPPTEGSDDRRLVGDRRLAGAGWRVTTTHDILRAIVKGYVTPESLAVALRDRAGGPHRSAGPLAADGSSSWPPVPSA